MRTLLQLDFPYDGPFGDEMASAMAKGLSEQAYGPAERIRCAEGQRQSVPGERGPFRH